MIYIVAALYGEAKPFIQHFQLKKTDGNKKFQEFAHPEKKIILVVTGVGSIPAAVAVSCICTEYGVQTEDILINIGTCASATHEGNVFLCNKITEETSGRTFYPDILYQHKFPEAGIVTVAKPVSSGLLQASTIGESVLYDMEAAAVYQAGAYFFGPHQMIFFKVISDRGEAIRVTREQLEQQVEKCAPQMIEYVEQICRMQSEECSETRDLSCLEKNLVSKVCEDLHCSNTMEASLRQHFRYLMLTGVDIETTINRWYEEEKLPCKDRREGKKRFEELKAGLL